MPKIIGKHKICKCLIIRQKNFSIGGVLTSATNSISNMLPHQSMPDMGMGMGMGAHVVGYVVLGTAAYYSVKKVKVRWTEACRPKWVVSVKAQYIQSHPNGDIKYKLDENNQIWNITLEGSCNKVVQDRVVLPDGHVIVISETCNHFWGSIVRTITKNYTYGYEYKIDNTNSLQPTPLLEISRTGAISVDLFSDYPEPDKNKNNWLTETNWADSLNKAFPNPSSMDVYRLDLVLVAKKGSTEYTVIQEKLRDILNKTPDEQVALFRNGTIGNKLSLLRTLDQFKNTETSDMVFGYGSRLKFERTRQILKANIESSSLDQPVHCSMIPEETPGVIIYTLCVGFIAWLIYKPVKTYRPSKTIGSLWNFRTIFKHKKK